MAKRVVLAAGALERPIVFGGNDRPGVMMASAVRTYLNRFSVAAGKRVVVFTSSDDGWTTAFDLANNNIAVHAIVDARRQVSPALLAMSKHRGTDPLGIASNRSARQSKPENVTVRDAQATNNGFPRTRSPYQEAGTRPSHSPLISAGALSGIPRCPLSCRAQRHAA